MTRSNSRFRSSAIGALLLAQTVILGCHREPAATVTQAGGDQPKFTISEVMNKAHGRKSNLARKLILGQISDQEKVKLIEYYEALGKATPPKGSATDWQRRTSNSRRKRNFAKLSTASPVTMPTGQRKIDRITHYIRTGRSASGLLVYLIGE